MLFSANFGIFHTTQPQKPHFDYKKSLINKFKLIILFQANKFDKDDEKEERNSTSSLSKVK